MTRFVFGTGICLINHWKLIEKNFHPDYCLDNDKKKWNTLMQDTGLLCISPQEIIKYDSPEVLITIGDPYIIDQITKQLDELHIPYKKLMDFLESWGEKEELPTHLQALLSKRNKKRIVLFNTPEHDNIGDHLISISEINFLKDRFSEYDIFEITDIEYTWFRKKIKSYIEQEDIILITGGGFLGSLWLYNGEQNVRNILNDYSQNKVIILPQTIYFEDNDRGKKEKAKSLQIYNEHPNLTICVRERKSFNILNDVKNRKYKVELIPDMALFYTPKMEEDNHTEKEALLCLRRDKERILQEEDQKYIKGILIKQGWHLRYTSMHSGVFSGISGRSIEVNKKLQEIHLANLVVTDTLHCMISAVITGTPCVAFDNLSGKVKFVYQWIEKLPYVHLCENISSLEEIIEKIISCKHEYRLETLDKLENRLEEVIRG